MPLPEPERPALAKPYAMLVTGIGGTGVVTVSAVLAQAAHLAGLGFGSIDVTGLAQKGGAVACHMRVAAAPEAIHAIRIGTAHADLILGGDLVVAASVKVLDAVRRGHTAIVVSGHEQTTGAFTRQPDLVVPGEKLAQAIRDKAGGAPLATIDAQAAAVAALGDSLYANMLLLGLAYQLGHVPIAVEAIELAIRLNGAEVEKNLAAFRLGRLAGHDRAAFDRLTTAGAGTQTTKPAEASTLEGLVARRAALLAEYQDEALAARYRNAVEHIAEAERRQAPGHHGLAEAVAKAYHKILAVKDEYEVARLLTDPAFEREVAATFDGVTRIDYHVAPPFLALRRDKVTGEPRKVRLGPWARPLLRLLAEGKRLRGGPLDVFAFSADRRFERRMIEEYEALLGDIARHLSPDTYAAAVALAALPQEVRGYGHVKKEAADRLDPRRRELLAELRAPRPQARRAAAE